MGGGNPFFFPGVAQASAAARHPTTPGHPSLPSGYPAGNILYHAIGFKTRLCIYKPGIVSGLKLTEETIFHASTFKIYVWPTYPKTDFKSGFAYSFLLLKNRTQISMSGAQGTKQWTKIE